MQIGLADHANVLQDAVCKVLEVSPDGLTCHDLAGAAGLHISAVIAHLQQVRISYALLVAICCRLLETTVARVIGKVH